MSNIDKVNKTLEAMGSTYRVDPDTPIHDAIAAMVEALPAYIEREVERRHARSDEVATKIIVASSQARAAKLKKEMLLGPEWLPVGFNAGLMGIRIERAIIFDAATPEFGTGNIKIWIDEVLRLRLATGCGDKVFYF